MSDESAAPTPPPIPPPPLPVLPPLPPPAWPPPGGAELPRPPRPGAVTAVAVASFVAAAVSLLGHVALLIGAAVVYVAPAIAPVTRATNPPAPVTAPTTSTSVNQDGLADQDRALAVLVFTSRQPLSPKRQEHLDAMLAQHGKRVLGPAAEGGPLTEHLVFEAITDQGQMPSADPSREGPDYYRTVAGRLEITDDGAVFYPGRNVYAPIRAAARPKTLALTPAEIQIVISQAQAAASTPLNGPQTSTLGVLLGAPNQTLVPPGATAAGPVVRSVTNQPDGTAVITLPVGVVGLGPQGQVVSPGAAPPTPTTARSRPTAALSTALASVAQVALAGLLIVAAIVLLRRTRPGRRLHLVYAFAEIPLAVLAGAAVLWVASAMHAAGAGPPSVLVGLAIALQAVGIIYAAVLVWVLNARAIREAERTEATFM